MVFNWASLEVPDIAAMAAMQTGYKLFLWLGILAASGYSFNKVEMTWEWGLVAAICSGKLPLWSELMIWEGCKCVEPVRSIG